MGYGASVSPDGTASVVWFQENGTNDQVAAATRPAGGSFGSPTDLAAVPDELYAADIAVGPLNQAVAVWDIEPDGYGVRAISTELPSLPVTVTKGGSGSGTVTSAPAGIDGWPGLQRRLPGLLERDPDRQALIRKHVQRLGRRACAASAAPTCSLTNLSEAKNATASFTAPPGKAVLKITKFGPKSPRSSGTRL